MKRNSTCAWVYVMLAVLSGEARGVVVSGAVRVVNDNRWGPETSLIIPGGTAEAHCYGAYIVVSHLNNELEILTGTAGTAHAWFQIAPGTAIDVALVLGGPFIFGGIGAPWDAIQQPMAGEPWLLGYWMDDHYIYDPNPGDCFGWMRLMDTPEGLVVVDDAMENSGAGIYAGTRTIVPEPSSLPVWPAIWLLTKRRSRRRFLN